MKQHVLIPLIGNDLYENLKISSKLAAGNWLLATGRNHVLEMHLNYKMII